MGSFRFSSALFVSSRLASVCDFDVSTTVHMYSAHAACFARSKQRSLFALVVASICLTVLFGRQDVVLPALRFHQRRHRRQRHQHHIAPPPFFCMWRLVNSCSFPPLPLNCPSSLAFRECILLLYPAPFSSLSSLPSSLSSVFIVFISSVYHVKRTSSVSQLHASQLGCCSLNPREPRLSRVSTHTC